MRYRRQKPNTWPLIIPGKGYLNPIKCQSWEDPYKSTPFAHGGGKIQQVTPGNRAGSEARSPESQARTPFIPPLSQEPVFLHLRLLFPGSLTLQPGGLSTLSWAPTPS